MDHFPSERLSQIWRDISDKGQDTGLIDPSDQFLGVCKVCVPSDLSDLIVKGANRLDQCRILLFGRHVPGPLKIFKISGISVLADLLFHHIQKSGAIAGAAKFPQDLSVGL